MAAVPDEDALAALSDDVGTLWCRPIAVLDSPPDSFTFLRDFVHPNVPCIIKNAIISDSGVAARPLTLTLDEIILLVGEDKKVTADVTPDGHGDCIRSVLEANHDNEARQRRQRRMFVKPHEQSMEIGEFRNMLRRRGRAYDGGTEIRCDKVNGNAMEMAPEVDCHGLEVFPLHHNSNCISDAVEHSDAKSCFDCVRPRHPPVVYYSRQNDCLRTELSTLFSARIFPPTLPFAERAFGTGPADAINMWIGNENSVSSMHKDHYENLFYVCSGQKEFLLCPPSDVVFLHEDEFSSATFRPMNGVDQGEDGESHLCSDEYLSWVAVEDNNDSGERAGEGRGQSSGVKTKWIEPDIKKHMERSIQNNAHNDDTDFPLLSKAHPVKVLVSEGEMLYLPSLWYHRVTQTCETVGVNYWYDMKFNSPHWCYFNFLQNLRTVEQKGCPFSKPSENN